MGFTYRRACAAAICSLALLMTGCSGESSGTSNDGGDVILEDDSVYAMLEKTSYDVLPSLANNEEENVERWIWSANPIRSGALAECENVDGFAGSLAARNLAEACTVSSQCSFSLDQVNNDSDSTATKFVVRVPVLKAPVGLSYQLRGLNGDEQITSTSATFCLIPINTAPIAVNDAFTVIEGEVFQITGSSAINLLSNDVDDVDRSNSPLSVATTLIEPPRFATRFNLNLDGGFSYLYDGDLTIQGSNRVVDTFRYETTDGIFTSSAEVRVTIVSRNNPPIVNGTLPAHTAIVGIPTEFDFSALFSDPEGSQLQYAAADASFPINSDFQSSVLGVISGTAAREDIGNYTINVSSSDGVSTVNGNVLLTVVDNLPPSATPLPDQTIDFGALVNLDVSGGFSDPEGVPLIFALASEPATDLIINPQTGLISGVLPATGAYSITIGASDGFNNPVTSTFEITQGQRPNRTPEFSGSIADQTVMLGDTPLASSGNFTDLDNDILSYTISSVPAGMAFDAATGELSGTPTQLGTNNLTITATDQDNASVTSNVFTLAVTAIPNNPPTFTGPVPAQSAIVGTAVPALSVTGFFDDPDAGDTLLFTTASGSSLPPGLSLSPAGVITGTPTTTGTFSVIITATDDDGIDISSAPFTYSVAAANIAPEITSRTPATDPITSIVVGSTTAITLTVIDEDTASLVYTASASPTGILTIVSAGSGTYNVTGVTAGLTTVTLTVTDNEGETDTEVFDVQVAPVNQPPVFAGSLSDLTYPEDVTITALDLSGFFSDADPLAFTSTPLPAGLNLSSAGVLTGTPSASGVTTVTITATDTTGSATGTPSNPFDIIVSANQPPVFSGPVPDQTFPAGALITPLDLSGFFADSDPMTFSSTTLPTGLVLSTAGILTGSPTAAATTTTAVTITATDPTGSATGTPSNAFDIIVTVNQPPVFSGPILDQTFPAGALITPLDLSGFFADSDPMTFSSTTLPTGLVLSTAGILTGSPTAAATTTSAVTITATDPTGSATGTPSNAFDIIVTVNQPPVFSGPVPDQTFPAGALITPLDLSGFFADSDPMTFSSTTLPTGLVLSTAGILTGSPTAAATTTTAVTITATDPTGSATGTPSNAFDIIVTVNQPPVFSGPILDQTFPAGALITPLDLSGFFADSDPMTFSSTTLPTGLILSTAGILTGSPTAAATTTTAVTITATDPTGSATGTPSNAFDIIVTVNQPPVFSGPILDQTFPAGALITPLDLSGFFADSDPMTFSSTTLPTGLVLSTAGILTGSPTAAATTTTAVTVTATDPTGSATGTPSNAFDIIITVNQPPVFSGPIPDLAFPAGVPITPVDLSGFFSDTDPMTFTSTALPAGLSFSPAGLLSGTPTLVNPLLPEVTAVIFTATDLTGSATGTDSNPANITIN